MERIKVVLVDDHQVMRDGIKLGLRSEKSIEIIGEASNSKELDELLLNVNPDIIIMDIGLPGKSGVEITREISNKYKILIFSASDEAQTIVESLQAGAKGFLPKHTISEEIIKAIKSIHEGNEYISEDISNKLIVSYISNNQSKIDESGKSLDLLTKREKEILKEIASGLSYKEIGEKLFISARTVETHKTHIMQKLQLKNLTELIKFALRNKIIEL